MRASRAAVAGGLLAALFAGTAVLASSSTPARPAGGANKTATPEVLARYAPPALPAELRRHVQAMFDVRSPAPASSPPTAGASSSTGP